MAQSCNGFWHNNSVLVLQSVVKVTIQNNELPLVQVFLNRERSTTAIVRASLKSFEHTETNNLSSYYIGQ